MKTNTRLKNGVKVSVSILLLFFAIQISIAQTITENVIGKHNGYDYELWIDKGTGSMKLGDEHGAYYADWKNSGQDGYNFLARTGKRPGSLEQVVEYDADYNPSGTSYLCVYGWFTDPLKEWYIVEKWQGYNPAQGTRIGSYNTDGGTYDLYTNMRYDKPSIEGNTTFQQYFAVRTDGRTSGTITCANHFQKWAEFNLEMGTMYEVSFTTEGYNSSGTCNVKKMIMTKGWPEDPIVTFTSPADEQNYMKGEEVTIAVDVQPKQGSVKNVEFYVLGEKIGEDNTAPYEITWTSDKDGTIPIKVIATDTEGWDTEEIRNVIVRVPQGPYEGTPHAIPGEFEFEHYDVGGQDSAYFDSTPGSETGVEFRDNESVDIEECGEGGYNLAYTAIGDWTEYTCDITGTGTFEMSVRYATEGDGRNLTVYMDGEKIADKIECGSTGEWQTYQDKKIEVDLKHGTHVLRFEVGGENNLNLNNVSFKATSNVVIPDDDECPNNPNKTKPGVCGCDEDDIDADNDGVYACDDLCDNNPDKTEPGECGCDVPEGECQKQEIELVEGWNLIGCPYKESKSLEEALSSIWENVQTVKNFESFYDKNYPDHLNLLENMKWGSGYVVKVNKACILEW